MSYFILDIEYEYIPLIKLHLICEIAWIEIDNNFNIISSES